MKIDRILICRDKINGKFYVELDSYTISYTHNMPNDPPTYGDFKPVAMPATYRALDSNGNGLMEFINVDEGSLKSIVDHISKRINDGTYTW